mgnify:CR=1 FL=1
MKMKVKTTGISNIILAWVGSPAGGVIFCCQNKSDRWGNTGYLIDYLAGGFRMLEMPSGAAIVTNAGVTTYEGRWRIELSPTTIRFLVNGVEQFTANDSRWRGGYLGFWCYTNGNQKMTADNLHVEFTPAACPT